MVILCISDAFADDEKCIQVFELIKNIIKKNYLLVELGAMGERKWIENLKFVSICSDFRIIMQDPTRYAHKLIELLEILERQVKQSSLSSENANGQSDRPVDVFISYCWANSNEAVNKGTKGTKTSIGWLDPRSIKF